MIYLKNTAFRAMRTALRLAPALSVGGDIRDGYPRKDGVFRIGKAVRYPVCFIFIFRCFHAYYDSTHAPFCQEFGGKQRGLKQ